MPSDPSAAPGRGPEREREREPTEIDRRFTYVAPNDERADKHALVNRMTLELAKILDASLPEGHEKEQAITSLQLVRMWANAAIATGGG